MPSCKPLLHIRQRRQHHSRLLIHLLRRRQDVRHHDRPHSGYVRRPDPVVRVFDHKCLPRVRLWDPELLRTAYTLGVTKQFLPEFDTMMETLQNNPHHCFTVGEHTIHAIQNTRQDLTLRLTMLLHDVGKPPCRWTDDNGIDHFWGHPEKGAEMTEEILRRLKYDNVTVKNVTRLVLLHDQPLPETDAALRRMVAKVGEELFPLLLEVHEADVLAQGAFFLEDKLELIAECGRRFDELMESSQCLALKDLAVSGKDLILAGISPGVEMGKLLQTMLEDVLDNPEHNTRDYLMAAYVEGRSS